MRLPCRSLSFLALAAFARAAAPVTDLFNGHDFAGWEFVTLGAGGITEVCRLLPGGVIAVSGQPVGFLTTTASYENYALHAEWRWPGKAGNGGVLLNISSGPKDRVWPLSIQVQTRNKFVGDLLPMAHATFAEPLTSAPGTAPAIRAHTGTDSEKSPGEWNSCDIICHHDTVEVKINGVLQNSVTHVAPASGRIGFQLEGTPFELRHVTLVRLD